MKSMLTLTLAGAFAVAASLRSPGDGPRDARTGAGHQVGQLAAGTDEGMQRQGHRNEGGRAQGSS